MGSLFISLTTRLLIVYMIVLSGRQAVEITNTSFSWWPCGSKPLAVTLLMRPASRLLKAEPLYYIVDLERPLNLARVIIVFRQSAFFCCPPALSMI